MQTSYQIKRYNVIFDVSKRYKVQFVFLILSYYTIQVYFVMHEEKCVVSNKSVKALMEVQEGAFRSMLNGLNEDIKDIQKDVKDLRSCLEFSQTGISVIQLKLDAANSQVTLQSKTDEEPVSNMNSINDQVEYLEDRSR